MRPQQLSPSPSSTIESGYTRKATRVAGGSRCGGSWPCPFGLLSSTILTVLMWPRHGARMGRWSRQRPVRSQFVRVPWAPVQVLDGLPRVKVTGAGGRWRIGLVSSWQRRSGQCQCPEAAWSIKLPSHSNLQQRPAAPWRPLMPCRWPQSSLNSGWHRRRRRR